MTDFVGEIEQELLDATNFKPERSYAKDRQKYLEALLRACAGLSDDEFDKLSDAAADWCNEAAGAKDKHPLPDFTNGEANAEGELPLGNGLGKATASDTPDTVGVVELEAVPEGVSEYPRPQPKKKGGRPKGSKTKKATVPVKVVIAKPKARKPRIPRPTANENIARKAVNGVNLWGVTIGCYADTACKMAAQEGGASMKEIREATGGNKYNLFNRLQKNGYDVKLEGGRVYLAKPVYQQVQSEPPAE